MANKNGKKATFDILASDSEGEEGNKLTINSNYAQRYDNWRSKEELQKLKDKLGPDGLGSDESSSEDSSTDEDSIDEQEFFRALSCLRARDPKIYDASANFFSKPDVVEDGPSTSSKKKKKAEKPFLLKDHEREMVLRTAETGDIAGSSDEEGPIVKLNPDPTSYVAEQNSIKKSFKSALSDDDDEVGDSYDKSDLLKKKTRTQIEVEKQGEDYRKWLKGEVDKLKGNCSKQEEKELSFLRNYWNNNKLDEGEQFLRDFFLNKKYIGDVEEPKNDVEDDVLPSASKDQDLSEDEEHVKEMETFEHKYNFRFEEPDAEFVKKYPRTIENSLRRAKTKRKEEREKNRQKKQEVKEKKLAEVQQYKALKRKEIQRRVQRLKEISGEDLGFLDADIDDDFDPMLHDKRMKELFSDMYYKTEEDEEKPVFPYDEYIDDEQESPTNIPTSSNASSQNQNPQSKSGRKRKKKGKTESAEDQVDSDEEEILKEGKLKSTAPPVFNSKLHGSYEDYVNEYFKHDFEDLVGDIPCRFKYRNVVPNDFGLSIDEILKAEDKELNEWASLKKTYLYRGIEEETYDVKAYSKKAALAEKKKRVFKSLHEDPKTTEVDGETDSDEAESSKELANGKKKKLKQQEKITNTESEITQASSKSKTKSGAGRKRQQNGGNKLDEDRLLAYGINPKKYDKRMKYKK